MVRATVIDGYMNPSSYNTYVLGPDIKRTNRHRAHPKDMKVLLREGFLSCAIKETKEIKHSHIIREHM
jgi:hypothetical protein